MTAGSGVIHAEMPKADTDRMHGFQFWLNLPASEKMQPPAYRDIQGAEVITVDHEDSHIRLISGSLGIGDTEVYGVVTSHSTRALIADVTLPESGITTLKIEPTLSAHAYVYRGSVNAGDITIASGVLACFGDGDALQLSATQDSGLLLFGGRPINEPVAHHGPFVMNTQEEIAQAIRDYQNGTLVRG